MAIRSPQNLFMLEKALAETDPETTDVVVMTAKLLPPATAQPDDADLDAYDQQLMTAVVERAEKAGKEVKPLIVPTNNPLHAVLKTATDLQAQELIMGASNKYTADEQLEQIAFYWINLHGGKPAPLTVRILSRDRDVYLDLGGGNRIPKISERQARSVAELRAAGVGVDRVLLLHDGSPGQQRPVPGRADHARPAGEAGPAAGPGAGGKIRQRPRRAARRTRSAPSSWAAAVTVVTADDTDGPAVVERPRAGRVRPGHPAAAGRSRRARPAARSTSARLYVLTHAHCRVFLAAAPAIPQEVVDATPSVM